METTKQVTPFFYKGPISSSKSLMNRGLIAKSFFPELKVLGQSSCADVSHMLKAIQNFPQHREIQCGDAGTVLRFMALRASREPGYFRLTGSQRLFQRPQEDLLFILNQLGVRAEFLPQEMIIESAGWAKPLMPIRIHREKSSQFATSLLMSCWQLPFSLEFELTPTGLHDSYWNMSVDFAESLGMQIEKKGKDRYAIPAHQEIQVQDVTIEPDYSSMFAIAATAALLGEARLEGVGSSAIQPDYQFIEILKKARVPIGLENGTLSVSRAATLAPINWIMRDTPDLFPVLAVLLAFAEGSSTLSGAPRLVHKESNRIKKTAELLDLMGIESEVRNDGLTIVGKGSQLRKNQFSFDPDQDHRMAMAAGLLLRAGWPIEIKNTAVVDKSFPEFWKILQSSSPVLRT